MGLSFLHWPTKVEGNVSGDVESQSPPDVNSNSPDDDHAPDEDSASNICVDPPPPAPSRDILPNDDALLQAIRCGDLIAVTQLVNELHQTRLFWVHSFVSCHYAWVFSRDHQAPYQQRPD